MKVLVTGGVGFIGSHVAEYYAEQGDKVTIYDNLTRSEILGKPVGDMSYNWNYLKSNYPNIKLVKADVRSFEELKNAARGSDVIVHTAAQVAVTTSLNNPRTDFEINALGTFNVLEVARLYDSAVILTSTNKVYGENINKIPVRADAKRYSFADKGYTKGIPETFPVDLCGHSPYGCSKLAADMYTQDYAQTYGLKTGVFRMSCVYGERQFGVEDQGWVAWFVIATLAGKSVTIYGDGKQVRDILYVKDLARALDAFLNSKLKHGVFNIGGGPENTISLLELVDLIKSLSGKKPEITFSSWRPADQKVYISDISKAVELLSWKPLVKPREGVRKLVGWVFQNLNLFA